MSAFVRVGRIVFLVAVCCSAAFVDLHPSRSASAPEANGSNAAGVQLLPESKSANLSVPQLGTLATELVARSKDVLPSGKLSNSSSMTFADISAKWSELQSRLLADDGAAAACRARPGCVFRSRTPLSGDCRRWPQTRGARPPWVDQSSSQHGGQAGERLGAVRPCRFLGITASNAGQWSRRL